MQPTSFEHLAGIICSVLDAYSACLFLLDSAGKQSALPPVYKLAAAFSLGNKVNLDARVQAGKGLVGWILRNQEPLLVSNFDQRQNHLGYYQQNEEHTIKAFMGYPLLNGRGALCVDSKRHYSFSEKDQKILHLFAGFIGQMQDDKQINEKESFQVHSYLALRTLYLLRYDKTRWNEFLHDFLKITALVGGFTYSVLFTLNPSETNFSIEGENVPLLLSALDENIFPITSGLAGWVFRHTTPVLSTDGNTSAETGLLGKNKVGSNFQTLYVLPLTIHRKTRGVLCFAHDKNMTVHEDVQDFIKMAAEYLALFLENLYLKNRLKQLHRQQSQ